MHVLLLSSGIVRLPATPNAGVPAPLVVHLPRIVSDVPAIPPPDSPAATGSVPPAVESPPSAAAISRDDTRPRALPAKSLPVVERSTGQAPGPTAIREPAIAPPSGATVAEPRPGGIPAADNVVPPPIVLAVPAPPDGPDAGALREYRWALIGKAGKPELDLPPGERGLSGRVDIRITVRPLKIPQVEVARSSGLPVLDDEAVRIMRRAAERARVPASLQGNPFSVELPVRFGPEER